MGKEAPRPRCYVDDLGDYKHKDFGEGELIKKKQQQKKPTWKQFNMHLGLPDLGKQQQANKNQNTK